MKPAIALLALCMTGCVTQQEQAAQQQARNEAYTRNLASQCEAVGYAPFTEGWKQCLMQLHSQQQARQTQMDGIMLDHRLQNLPRCAALVPGEREFRAAQGTCRQ